MMLNRPGSVDTTEPAGMLVLELYRRKPIGMAMSTLRVVEHLDVVQDVAPRLLAVSVYLSTNLFPLE